PGYLMHDKLIKWQIPVDPLDDPVSITPCFQRFAFISADAQVGVVVIRIASHIEPMSRPTLAVSWRSKQPIYDSRESIGRIVAEKGRDFVGRRRKPREIEGCPAQQRAPV